MPGVNLLQTRVPQNFVAYPTKFRTASRTPGLVGSRRLRPCFALAARRVARTIRRLNSVGHRRRSRDVTLARRRIGLSPFGWKLHPPGLLLLLFTTALPAADRDWPVYLGDKASSHFSPLKQINTRNVHRLEVVW